MLIPTIIMAVLAIALLLIGYFRGQGQHTDGLRSAWKTTVETLPLLIFAFVVGGMVQVLVPREAVAKWIGTESGLRGILIGTVAGSLIPGGPYVSLPIAAGLVQSGTGAGTVIAFLTGWSLWALSRLPMEVGILGWKYWLIRVVSTFFFPPIAGLIAQALYVVFK